LPKESASFSIEGEPHYCEILFMIW
jgi:hypothetical protein